MGALANEIMCGRCNVGSGTDGSELPPSWAFTSVTEHEGAFWIGYLCEACRRELNDWLYDSGEPQGQTDSP